MSATLATELHSLLRVAGPAALGPESRLEALSADTLRTRLDGLLRRAGSPAHHRLICSLLLLWHDHLEASHEISQPIETADGSLVHGLMHRREPDYWNSKYWFRRVGSHPAFVSLAGPAGPLLAAEPKLRSRLLPRGEWDPFAFVDAVEEAAGRSGTDSRRQLLRSLQQAEFESMLNHLLC